MKAIIILEKSINSNRIYVIANFKIKDKNSIGQCEGSGSWKSNFQSTSSRKEERKKSIQFKMYVSCIHTEATDQRS